MANDATIQDNAVDTTSKPKSNGKKTSKKKLLSTSEFSRIAAVGTVIASKGYSDADKVITEADKLYKERTGVPSNLKETKTNFQFAVRLLKAMNWSK